MGKGLLYAALFTIHFSLFTSLTSCTRDDDLEAVVEEYDPENAYGTYSESHWRLR